MHSQCYPTADQESRRKEEFPGPHDQLRSWTAAAITSSRNTQSFGSASALVECGYSAASEAIRNFVIHRLVSVAYDHNSRRPLVALPLVLLRRIFGFISQDDRWPLSQTCRHLRSCCLGTPSLWQTILPLDWWHPCRITPGFTSIVSLLAARSLPGDLNFRSTYIIADERDEESVIALLLPIAHRLRFVAVHGLIKKVVDALQSSSLVLAEAKLTTDPGDPRVELPSGLFGGVGALRMLKLRRVDLPAIGKTCPALSNLRTFHWEDPVTLDVDPDMFRHILTLMPRLEHLHLLVQNLIWRDEGIVIPEVPSFRSFTLWFENEASHLLRFLRDVGSITQFRCISSKPPPIDSLLDGLAEHEVTAFIGPTRGELLIHPDTLGRPLSVIGDVRTLLGNNATIAWKARMQPSPSAAGLLTTLSLHEFFWPSLPIPPLPRLRWLRVTLGCCLAYQLSWIGRRDSILARWNLAAWNAPVLETLVIAHIPPPQHCQQILGNPPYQWIQANQTCFCAQTLAVSLTDVVGGSGAVGVRCVGPGS